MGLDINSINPVQAVVTENKYVYLKHTNEVDTACYITATRSQCWFNISIYLTHHLLLKEESIFTKASQSGINSWSARTIRALLPL